MSRRRISGDEAARIGAERVSVLKRLSHEAARSGNDGRARRYVDIAVRICRKTRTRMPRDFRFCKGCGVPMLPGVTSRVRLTGGKVVCTCLRCGRAARMPYQRERRA